MKKIILNLILLVSISATIMLACNTTGKKSLHNADLMDEQTIAQRNNSFAFDIFNAVNNQDDANLIISPFSISTALAMTYAGAREETAEQMAETLKFHPNQEIFHPSFHQWMSKIEAKGKNDNQLQLANALWPQEDFHFVPSYFDLINQFYHSAIYEVDYMGDREAIRTRINQWVLDNTNNLIDNLIKPGVLIEDTRLVLVNAIYFLSQWQIAFDEKSSRSDSFFVSKDKSKEVSFMFMKDTLNYFENENLQLLELQYKGGDFSMVIALPAKDYPLEKLIPEMDSDMFTEMLEKSDKQEVEVHLPSFKVRAAFDLEKTMAGMGMPLAFTNQANFSGMTQENDLKIDKIIHQAYIDVNEEGTEAAASTAVVIIRKSAMVGEQATVFKANRPFLYFIKENQHNSILFMGKTGDPSLKNE